MEIVLGSKNKTKIKAVHTVFPSASIKAVHIPSGVDKQPMTDLETRKGAIQRAIGAAKHQTNVFGLGLEGGIMMLEDELYLCNWVAVCTPNGAIYTAAGGRFVLPKSFQALLEQGMELSDIMVDYTKKATIRHHEGAVGIFTNNMVERSELFVHALMLIKGQLAFDEVI